MHALAGALSPYGEVFVFAPKSEQSGVSHAFTVRRGLLVEEVPSEASYKVFSMDGTPADCTKFALGHFASYGLEVTEGHGPGAFQHPGLRGGLHAPHGGHRRHGKILRRCH